MEEDKKTTVNNETNVEEESIATKPTVVTTTTEDSDSDSDSDDDNYSFSSYVPYYLRREEEKAWVEPATIEEKRKLYACGNRYVTLEQIETYPQYAQRNKLKDAETHAYPYNPEINDKISIWKGDMTHLEIDGVHNAANNSLLGGGGIDGCIHRAAGSYLRKYNATLGGCKTGNTKLSPGFKLPAKYILSTVGPMGEDPVKLRSAYETTLQLVEEHNLKSVALCCVSTGIFGYPLENASHIALDTVRAWLDTNENYKKIDRIIFVTFLEKEVSTYNRLVPQYFPLSE
jgi:O-acetyl-ADP-ribose deacetylase (regulator of RNase III)